MPKVRPKWVRWPVAPFFLLFHPRCVPELFRRRSRVEAREYGQDLCRTLKKFFQGAHPGLSEQVKFSIMLEELGLRWHGFRPYRLVKIVITLKYEGPVEGKYVERHAEAAAQNYRRHVRRNEYQLALRYDLKHISKEETANV